VRSAFLPTGVRLNVAAQRTELRDAEKLLRRAVELKPDFAEAHIRLGRVLEILGHTAEAAEHLVKGVEATDEPPLRYYGSLFLGAAEAQLGHDAAARAAYERAAALFPNAQSPPLGLSELARRAGHRDEALREIEKVYRLESTWNRTADPWWTYNYAQGRNADALLDALQKPFRLTADR
jgi:protein O-GlcNAc transferase